MNNEKYLKWIMPSIKNRTVPQEIKGEQFNFRVTMAKEQLKLYEEEKNKWCNKHLELSEKDWKGKHKKDIVAHVNYFLSSIMNMKAVDNPYIKPKNTKERRIEYSKINTIQKEDIVWIKFTTSGVISVVGTACDIYFTDFAEKNTTAGRINQILNQKWDDTVVLVFPLVNIPDGLNRSDIESGIGNYLISQGVPILDYYSHNY